MAKVEKKLVRNPCLPVRTCKVTDLSDKVKKVHFKEEDNADDISKTSEIHFLDSPEFCTTLQLANEASKMRNAQCSPSTISKEMKYKNLNFLPNEKIFQNLIDLHVPEKQPEKLTRSQTVSRCVLKKDPEPNYESLLNYPSQPDYSFLLFAVPSIHEQSNSFDGRSIYNKDELWNK